jgi:hypothetical protein
VAGTYRAAAVLAVLLFAVTTSVAARPVSDRLERFRELVSERLAGTQVLDAPTAAEAYREAYALFDDEIVESLASGGVFASTAFLQDRLDAFSDAWGGAAVRMLRLGRLTVGVFHLDERGTANSVRVYGRLNDEPALLTALTRDGRPTLFPLPPGPASAVQFLVAWDDVASSPGIRPVRLDVVRQEADGVRATWSTAGVYPDPLLARSYVVRGSELRVRYLLRYPGWIPGCESQTEQEDVYRLTTATGTYLRASQQQFQAWHKDVRASATRLFEALASGDERTVAGLVPDAKVRQRLPARLEAQPVCDAPSGPRGEQVAVAASDGHGAPWTVTFQRGDAGRWRVTAASPVIP